MDEEKSKDARVFAGIPLPAATIDVLAAVQRSLRPRAEAEGMKVSWERPEKMHVSVQFLGNIARNSIASLGEALDRAAARHRAFRLELGGLGAFPPGKAPRVLFAGLGAGHDDLAALAESVAGAAEAFGVAREARRFHGHVTLGRVRTCPRRLRIAALGSCDELRGSFPVEEVVLFESVLGPGGSRYSVLSRHPLIRDIRTDP